MGWTIGVLGFDSRRGLGIFSLYHHVQKASGDHSASYTMGTRGSFRGGKADNSPPSSAEVKECVSCTSTPPIRLHGLVLSLKKCRDNYILVFIYGAGGQNILNFMISIP
jgi:hypothetical protein